MAQKAAEPVQGERKGLLKRGTRVTKEKETTSWRRLYTPLVPFLTILCPRLPDPCSRDTQLLSQREAACTNEALLFATKSQGPEFESPAPTEKPDDYGHECHPSVGWQESELAVG